MVSLRNFFSIMLMMAVILFMFQFSQIIKEHESNYDVNPYISAEKLSGKDKWEPERQALSYNGNVSYESGTFMVYLGDDETDVYNTVHEWCNYMKYDLAVYGDTDRYRINENHMPRAIMVDSNTIDVEKELDFFEELTEYDVTVIFCNLPEPEVISNNERLKALLGIRGVWDNDVETEGIYTFAGFLLGGDSFYKLSEKDLQEETQSERKKQDLNLHMPWYVPIGGTKTYMIGILDEMMKDLEERNEYFPAVIWRHNIGDSELFLINGDYMNDMTGLGILSAMMYESDSYALYPIVNAQNISIVNFPGFADENNEKIMELYSRSPSAIMRDICWPALVSVTGNSNYRPTCLMTAQYDYSDSIQPSSEDMQFYLQQFKEFNTEAGLSLGCLRGSNLDDKLNQDESFYNKTGLRYVYTSAYMGETELAKFTAEAEKHPFLKTLRTVTGSYGRKEPVISYYNDDVTLQNCVTYADFHSYSDNMYLKSIETALGYNNIFLDMYNVIWPESKDDQWENVSEKVASNINTYMKPFNKFERTTLSESDVKIRNYLNMDYNTRREDNVVWLDITKGKDSCFMFRTHGEAIEAIDGAEYVEIEDGSYIIYAQKEQVKITLKKDRGLLKFDVENGG